MMMTSTDDTNAAPAPPPAPAAPAAPPSPPPPPPAPPPAPSAAGAGHQRVLFLIGGSRGDVEPACAVALALAAAGHEVCVCADQALAPLVADLAGLRFCPLGGDVRRVMQRTVEWGGMLPTSLEGLRFVRGQVALQLDGARAAVAAFAPTLLVCNQLAWAAPHLAEVEAGGVPCHLMLTVPWLPTRERAHPWARAFGRTVPDAAVAGVRAALRALGGGGAGGGGEKEPPLLQAVRAAANYASGPLLDWCAFLGVADLTARLRWRLGLPLATLRGLTATAAMMQRLPAEGGATCLFSQVVVARPGDWPPRARVVGYARLAEALARFGRGGRGGGCKGGGNAAAAAAAGAAGGGGGGGCCACASCYEPPPALAAFLAAPGPPVLFVGLGSAVVGDAAAVTRLVLGAAAGLLAGPAPACRLLLSAGWAGLGKGLRSSNGDDGGGSRGGDGTSTPSGDDDGDDGDDDGDGSSTTSSSSSRTSSVFVLGDDGGAAPPHDWLFPLCRAGVVCHGGVGTVAAALRAGRRVLVLPSFGDLFLWGERAHALGAGPAPLPLDELLLRPDDDDDDGSNGGGGGGGGVARLAASLNDLVADEGGRFNAAAAAVAAALRREEDDGGGGGLEAAARSVLAAATAGGGGGGGGGSGHS